MCTALLFSAGSRGDTEPILALSVALLATGKFERVHLCLQKDYIHLVPADDRITVHSLPFAGNKVLRIILLELLKEAFFYLFTGQFDPIVATNRGIANVQYYCVAPSHSFLRSLVAQVRPDIIISTSITAILTHALALHHKIPFATICFQPTHVTRRYPYMLTDMPTSLKAARDIARLHKTNSTSLDQNYVSSYKEASWNYLAPSFSKVNDFREALGLKRIKPGDLDEERYGPRSRAIALYAYPKAIIPPDPSWSPNIRVVNAFADAYLPPGWTPEEKCPRILDFLSQYEKPFLVTFGSMKVLGRVTWVSRQLLQGLRAGGIERVLLLKGGANLGAHNLGFADADLKEWAAKHVFFSDESPQYSWLMPLCRGVLCHGGAGTTFASLRAGLPTVIAPVAVDQFFWGRLVEDMGLGATVEPSLRDASVDRYAKAIKFAMQPCVSTKVAQFGEKMRKSGNGAKIAAEMISDLVS